MPETNSNTPQLHLSIVTPEDTVLETQADFVALPLFDGELGVGLHHSPMIGRLRSGEVRVRVGSTTTLYYVEGGFVQVANNGISIMTGNAQLATEVDATAAQQQLEESLASKAAGEEQISIRSQRVEQSRAKLRIANRAAENN